MKTEDEHGIELVMGVHLVSPLESAVKTWYGACHRLQFESGSGHVHAYCEATDILAREFRQEYAEGPKTQAAFEQFRQVLIEQDED
jgi:hypothetical protein